MARRKKKKEKKGKRDTRKIRYCLKCGRPFVSTWIGNRICPMCRKAHENIYTADDYKPSAF